jgi:TRAP-type mannitol/chloroaromatic compound transport system substrate-binding protein
MMKRKLNRRCLLLILLLLALFVASAPVSAAAPEQYKWKMATAVAENSYFYNEFVLRFVRYAKALTDGQADITPYGAGVVTPAFKVYDSVQDGLVETGHSSPGYLLNKDPVNGLLAAFPGGMSADAMFHWLYFGGGRDLWVAFREKEMGLHPLIVGMHGPEVFAHSKKPIRNAEDLKGLKHRTGGANTQILREYFAGNPVAAAQAEIFGLLEKGAIDSAEFATAAANVSDGYHEIAKYVIVPGIHTPASPWELVIKKDRWDALPKSLQAKLDMAAELATYESYLKIGLDDLAAMQKFRAGKNEIVQLSPALIQKYREAGRDWANKRAKEQKAKGNDWMERIWASYHEFQDRWTANAGFRVKDE